MGMRHQFKCTGCRYSAVVSGGNDAGMAGCTTTIYCQDCRSLQDVFVSLDPSDTDDTPPACAKSPQHAVRSWNHQDPCPRCGTTMENDGITMLWD